MNDDLTYQQERIKHELSLLIRFLRGPDDLAGLYKIAPELQEVIQVFMERADDKAKAFLVRLQAELRQIIDGTIDVGKCFPSSRPSKHRKTMKNYYGSHPLYSLFWHRAISYDLIGRYRSLIASMLPVLLKLEHEKIKDAQYVERAVHLARSLRQLSQPEKLEKLVFLELPGEVQSPATLCARLEAVFQRFGVTNSGNKCESFRYVHTALTWHLTGVWGSGRRSLFKRYSSAPTRSSPRHGAAETDGDAERISLHINFTNDEPRRVAHFFMRPEKELAEEEQFDPNASFDDVPIASTCTIQSTRAIAYFIENRRRSASRNAVYAAQAIEQANQFLPVTRATLSEYEIELFLSALSDLEMPVWQGFSPKRRLEVAAWAACSLYLGRLPEDLKRIVSDQWMIVVVDPIVWSKELSTITFPAVGPKHGHAGAANVERCFLPVDSKFSLVVPDFLANLMDQLSATMRPLFSLSYEREFERLLRAINQKHQVELSPARIRRVVADEINRLAPVDRVLGAYFRGDLPNNYKPAVYSAVPVARIQSLYGEASRRIFGNRGLFGRKVQTWELPAISSESERYIGSKYVLRQAFVRSTIDDLKNRIAGITNTSMASFAVAHNTYTAYLILFLAATTGIRPVSRWIAAEFDIDDETGFCFVSDKDSQRYRNAHLVWLHPMLRLQLQEYARHVVRLRRHLALVRLDQIERIDAKCEIGPMSSHQEPDRISDLALLDACAPEIFLLTETGHVIKEAAPMHVSQYLGEDWKRRIGALRHFVRSQMLRSACSGEIINAMLGHAERGENAWARFSTMPPSAWSAKISDVVGSTLKVLGFEVMTSPLIGKPR